MIQRLPLSRNFKGHADSSGRPAEFGERLLSGCALGCHIAADRHFQQPTQVGRLCASGPVGLLTKFPTHLGKNRSVVNIVGY